MNHKQRNNLLDEALTLHRSLQHEEAERVYARVRRECPRDFDAWFLSGALAFQRGGHLEKAVELLEKARKLKADSIECRLFLGMALADLSRFAEAEPHLSWALKKVHNKPEAWEMDPAKGLKTEPAPWVDKDGKPINWYAGKQWDDDIGDYDRQLLEMGANAIRQLIVDRLQAMNRAEHLEAYCHSLMAQNGGAS